MKYQKTYQHLKDDLLAIGELLLAGQIDYLEAQEMRKYVEELAV